jgi:hypothetical protein
VLWSSAPLGAMLTFLVDSWRACLVCGASPQGQEIPATPTATDLRGRVRYGSDK